MLLEIFEDMLTLIGGLILVYFVYVLISRKDDKPSAEPPTMAHAALRELVERAVDEARKLPSLGTSGNSTTNSGSGQQEGRNVVEQSYEDLLATAILNKVIEKFQREQVDGNSNVLLGKPSSRTKYAPSESELGLDEGVEEGSSSLEPLSQDECSSDCSAPRTRHPRNHQDPVSLTIEERIEEVTTTYTSDEDRRVENDLVRCARRVPFPEFGMDIIDPSQESSDESQDELDSTNVHVDHISPIESWEENWLFQKKRAAQNQSDSVAMLVPNSSTDFKALIGDKDAEDTSDLSECSSAQSDEEIEKELMEAINNVVPRSPNGSQSDLEMYTSERSNGPSGENLCNGIGDHHEVNVNGYQDKEEVIERKSGLIVEENSKDDNSRTCEPGRLINGDEITEKVDELEEKNISRTVRLKDADLSGATSQVKSSQDQEQLKNNQNQAEPVSRSDCAPSGKESSSDEKRTMEGAMNGSTEENHSKIQLESLTFSLEENLSREVPKTPTPSPARVSVTEDGADVVDKGENPSVTMENVLDSLESAKRKLMDVNDEPRTATLLQEENSSSLQNGDKNEFQAEEEAQQDSEYTEHYDTATQRHLDSLTRTYVSERETDSLESITAPKTGDKDPPEANDKCREAFAKAEAASLFTSTNKCDTNDDDVQLATPPRPGSIAEREHKKWENAAPIENNPYSEENIQRRLWERQYSRRSSDIPGVQHSELPKSDGAELDVVLRLNQPDIARFGRDYYINESKVPSGDRTRRSTTSLSSRPSSSLSQRSGSTAADQEQQVSYRILDSFEEASLRGSLSRWSCRDPRASQNFAINPLLRMEGHADDDERDLNPLDTWAERSTWNREESYNETGQKDSEDNQKEEFSGSCRQPRASMNLAVNPLLRMEGHVDDDDRGDPNPVGTWAQTSTWNREENRRETARNDSVENRKEEFSESCSNQNFTIDPLLTKEIDAREDRLNSLNTWAEKSTRRHEVNDEGNAQVNLKEDREEFSKGATVAKGVGQTANDLRTNPLYQPDDEEGDRSSPERAKTIDRDSGMDSIESNDLENSKAKVDEQNCLERLSWMENGKEDQILLSTNGKKYWNTWNWNYQTFGGIRRTNIPRRSGNLEEDPVTVDICEDPSLLGAAEFAKFKFQTFGGVKRSDRVDGRKIPTYRVIKLRPSLHNLKNLKGFRSQENMVDPSTDLDPNQTSQNLEADWQDEDDRAHNDPLTLLTDSLARTKRKSLKNESPWVTSRRRSSLKRRKRKPELVKEDVVDDEWQDEDHDLYDERSMMNPKGKDNRESCRRENRREHDDIRVIDNSILAKFLDDASKRPKCRLSTDDSAYTLRSKSRRGKSNRRIVSFDRDESLKLEAPVVPQVVERRFATLKELRDSGSDGSSRRGETGAKKLGVRSLSDVTIW